MTDIELIQLARQAQNGVYAPYSKFKVGAAVLTADNNVYCGGNVENASYGLSVCAERIAIFKAVNAQDRKLTTIAIASDGSDYIYPCGACLQVMAEFSPQLRIIVTDGNNNNKNYMLSEVLPQAFSLKQIGG